MLLTQFVTLGLLTLTTAGGAALGYSARVRQEKLIAGRRIDSDRREVSVIPAKETPLTIGGRASRSRAAEQG
jgi:hypothetical protein